MAPELRVVPSADGPAPFTFRADARPALWGAALLAIFSIAAAALGFSAQLPPLGAAPLSAALLLGALWLFASGVSRRTAHYSLTAQRLEIARGLLSRRIESIELWRVRDVVLDQGLFERLRGVGRLTLYSSDQVEPVLTLGPVTSARALFERLRDAVAAARKDARVVPVDSGR
jgi:membrane protein YdbS with pleckstrin-like domain